MYCTYHEWQNGRCNFISQRLYPSLTEICHPFLKRILNGFLLSPGSCCCDLIDDILKKNKYGGITNSFDRQCAVTPVQRKRRKVKCTNPQEVYQKHEAQ